MSVNTMHIIRFYLRFTVTDLRVEVLLKGYLMANYGLVVSKRKSIVVLQSLAYNQLDVDAIYRITMPMPFSFRQIHETKPLLIPTGVLTPYNVQPTLHFRAAAYHSSW